nr:hypothetical protein Iba_chr13cCG0150 [Ipomoea batatas]GMD80447.1 hypothetical protein Iba_chr13eCG1950 [Ipomoea batatas]GME12455.1 hypothetical protein Iba_scaffold13764CG0020 [Ipomoea batatas]
MIVGMTLPFVLRVVFARALSMASLLRYLIEEQHPVVLGA